MRKTIKNLIIVVLAVALVVQAVEFVQARPYVLGGQQDTYYSILACTDGLRFDVGLYVPNAPSTPKASFSRVDYRSESILDGASFPLNGPSNVTIQDGQSGASIMLSHTGSFTVPWPNGANDPTIMPGWRIRIVSPQIYNAGQNIGVASQFWAIVQPCTIKNLPPDREARVFYPPYPSTEYPGLHVPDVPIPPHSVITSTISVNFGAGKSIADVNVGMMIKNVVPNGISVFLISPAGTRIKLFANQNSNLFGTHEVDLDGTLVRDPMPDFVLDDESAYNFGDATVTPSYVTKAIKPAEALAQLNGEDPNGNWLLEIQNNGTVYQPFCETTSDTPALSIPDNDPNGVVVHPFFPKAWLITDVNVTLDITHGRVGDLIATLKNPSKSASVVLFNQVGGDGDSFTNTRLDDDAALSISEGTAPFTGSYRPSSPLVVFDGGSWAGQWDLLVHDDDIDEQGTLNSWEVELCGGPAGVLDSWALDIAVEQSQHSIYLPNLQR
ncbi:MAG: proprotein convertase P-domain-containing protein [Caldilineaceae bacterium]|nr:proprotein convertase P-domain-containing protein [Caldilineaceae bacterium]MBP8106828.1 proprotein convertase P-domain-containing protein [Caldilineaceae bacterium]MBP8121722.1 proprotein convertase P-domain-containing protein [Caldilineaceae bacterium]MBP9071488.1 proprotein convertase P-domain-containing protein [Caldilineaceae bacterium]